MRSVFSSQSPPLHRGGAHHRDHQSVHPGVLATLCPATAPFSSTTCGTGRME
ncbi:hypothetical protein CEXT_151121, partial [Caerostris extrusa]